MKNLITAAIIAGGAIMSSPSAFGAFVADNLYLGFENQAGGGTADYIINLGPASGIVGGSTVVDLSTYFSLANFNSVLGGSSSMLGGVAGGNAFFLTPDVYATQLRSALGTPSVAGSTAPSTISAAQTQNSINQLSSISAPAAGTGVLDTTLSWETYVEPTFTANSFWGASGINPDSSVAPSSVLYEDLYYATNGSSFAYQGYVTLDLTGGSPKLTFTPQNTPGTLPKPVIVSVSKTGSTVTVISSNAVPTHMYQLEYTASLSAASWNNTGGSMTASATMVTNSDSTATVSPRFYRVQGQ